MRNKKVAMCIIMFLVVLVFGIIGPDLSKRTGNTGDKTTENTTEYFQNSYDSNTTEIIISTQEIVSTENDTTVEVTATTETNTSTEEIVSTKEATETDELVSTEIAETTEDTVESNNSSYKSEKYAIDAVNAGIIMLSAMNNYILSADVEAEIDKLVDGMTLEEKVGQIFFIKNDGRFDGSILNEYPVGGVILFKGDFVGKTEQGVKDSIANLQNNSKIPLLIGIDEEGGTVVRLSCYSLLAPYQFRSPRDVYYAGGFAGIEEDTVTKSELLLSYGINVNFAPVCDVPDSNGDFIYTRSFSEDVELTEQYVQLMVETMNECNMGSVLKHFPGYGNNVDTHNSVARDLRSIEEFENVDLKPFQAGIDSGSWCILISHNIVECMDKDNPASLSADVHNLLRQDMKFGGVIITDDLMMNGIANLYTKEEAAVQAVLSGNDMILATDYQVQYEAVLNAVKSGRIKEEQLEESIKRILRWKYSLGLLDI